MADNPVLPATGVAVAGDDIAGVLFQRVKLIYGADGANEGDVSSANPLPVNFTKSATVIDTSTTPLGIGASYTSPTLDHSINGAYVTHYVKADVDGTHYAEESHDGTNWVIADTETVTGGTPLRESHQAIARYSRARYVNGGVAQTTFYHQVIQKHIGQDEYVKIHSDQNIVKGDRTADTGAPSNDNFAVLSAIAQAAAPSWTEGRLVLPRVTLTGDLAITLDGEVIPVTGTFWQATQPVSGTFYQATQPVSIATMPSTPVTGTFWQATQPVSGTVTASNAAGDVAHDGVDSGNPVKIGGIARTAWAAVSAALDRVSATFDLVGRQIIRLNAPRGLRIKNTITLTSTTETTLLAQAASTFHDLTKVVVSNTSATAVRVDFRDATAGTVVFSILAPAGQTVGFTDSGDPIEQAAVNTNWTAQLSAAVTDVRIFAQAVKNIA